jgi:hypothetical protein
LSKEIPMIFQQHSVTFDEVNYNPQELYDTFSPMFGTRKVLSTNKTAGTCEIVDVNTAAGMSVKDFPEVQRLAKCFKVLEKENTVSGEMARIFYHDPLNGIPPHIDEQSNCAILLPITWPISPVIYLDLRDKEYSRGAWWDYDQFRLDDITWIHQYQYGNPSLINSQILHTIRNTTDTPRAILRFKISAYSYEECLEMCKNGTFLDLEYIESLKNS